MFQVAIDRTEVHVSRLAFGTGSLHHIVRQAQRLRLLESAFAAGITHYDTAPYYGNGLAELDLGMFLKQHRGSVTIATKVGLHPPGRGATGIHQVWARKVMGKLLPRLSLPRVDWSQPALERSLADSLRRLRTDYVDFLFLHEPDPGAMQSGEVLQWLQESRAAGKLLHWGVAGDPRRMEAWLKMDHPLVNVIQARDSISECEADAIARAGRRFQFTYGYLSSVPAKNRKASAAIVLRQALSRNASGAVVFSTRLAQRVVELAKALL